MHAAEPLPHFVDDFLAFLYEVHPTGATLDGVHVHAHESGVLAKELMEQIFSVHGVPQVVHADRGTSMTSKTVAALLADLDVTRSHSRPKVSNDNPYVRHEVA